MREVILNYWKWFADLVNPYHDVINTISTIVIAAFAVDGTTEPRHRLRCRGLFR